MNTIGSRLRAARKKCKLTLKDVNESIGISTGNLSELENDIKQPSSQTLISLKSLYNISIDWVLTGEISTGYNNIDFELTREEQQDLYTILDFLKFRRKRNITDKNTIETEESNKNLDTYPITKENPVVYLPVLGDTATGTLIEGIKAYKGDLSNSFVIRARGNSMIGANIKDGDLVIFKAQPMVENGEIALINVNGEATIKYFYLNDEECELRSANPAYPPVKYSIDEISIIGKFVEVLEHK